MKEVEDYLNKVICGDSLEIMKQLPDKCIDLVLTDPPYGVDYVGGQNEREREREIAKRQRCQCLRVVIQGN